MSEMFDSLLDPSVSELLKSGKVGVMPTDTVYGLACRAANEDAVRKLYGLKSRESKPGTIIAASVDQLVELGIKRRYLKAVEAYWPSPMSVVVPSFSLEYIHLGVGSLAVRVTNDETLLDILQKTGPLLTTSANHPGEEPSTTIQMAQTYFGKAIDFYVDGGDLSDRKPSTIIRIVDDAIEILREGAIKINEKGEIIQ